MPRLIFRPYFYIGIFFGALATLVAAMVYIVVALGSFWFALPVCVPLLLVCILCLIASRRFWQQRVELNDCCINYRDGQNSHSFRYGVIERICVSRGEAFDAQAPINLILMPQDESERTAWNLADFGLLTNLRIALALAKRTEVNFVAITLHGGREKELRAITRKLGTLTLLPESEPEAGKNKNWFVTFSLELHR